MAEHHRHNVPPRGWLFGVALEQGGTVVAVGMAGRPVNRHLDDGRTLEVLRVCTLGTNNAASRIYGALCRAGQALGYTRADTYTLASEPGTSLRASGFSCEGDLGPRPGNGGWAGNGRPRYESTLWGQAIMPAENRVRWARELA